METTNNNAIPEQRTGLKTDVQHEVECKASEQAIVLFNVAKQRLLNVSNWKTICGSPSADFQLTDSSGHNVTRPAQRGDKFRIDIPAPGTHAGDGFDWVEVEEITEQHDGTNEIIAMRVRPCPNPLTPPDENDTADFYTSEATSTFTVKRRGNMVSAEVHGRNEKPNTETHSIVDKARNALIALPATTGLAKVQWSRLVEGWMEP